MHATVLQDSIVTNDLGQQQQPALLLSHDVCVTHIECFAAHEQHWDLVCFDRIFSR